MNGFFIFFTRFITPEFGLLVSVRATSTLSLPLKYLIILATLVPEPEAKNNSFNSFIFHLTHVLS